MRYFDKFLVLCMFALKGQVLFASTLNNDIFTPGALPKEGAVRPGPMMYCQLFEREIDAIHSGKVRGVSSICRVLRSEEGNLSSGTGFFISDPANPDYLSVLTAAHVVADDVGKPFDQAQCGGLKAIFRLAPTQYLEAGIAEVKFFKYHGPEEELQGKYVDLALCRLNNKELQKDFRHDIEKAVLKNPKQSSLQANDNGTIVAAPGYGDFAFHLGSVYKQNEGRTRHYYYRFTNRQDAPLPHMLFALMREGKPYFAGTYNWVMSTMRSDTVGNMAVHQNGFQQYAYKPSTPGFSGAPCFEVTKPSSPAVVIGMITSSTPRNPFTGDSSNPTELKRALEMQYQKLNSLIWGENAKEQDTEMAEICEDVYEHRQSEGIFLGPYVEEIHKQMKLWHEEELNQPKELPALRIIRIM